MVPAPVVLQSSNTSTTSKSLSFSSLTHIGPSSLRWQ